MAVEQKPTNPFQRLALAATVIAPFLGGTAAFARTPSPDNASPAPVGTLNMTNDTQYVGPALVSEDMKLAYQSGAAQGAAAQQNIDAQTTTDLTNEIQSLENQVGTLSQQAQTEAQQLLTATLAQGKLVDAQAQLTADKAKLAKNLSDVQKQLNTTQAEEAKQAAVAKLRQEGLFGALAVGIAFIGLAALREFFVRRRIKAMQKTEAALQKQINDKNEDIKNQNDEIAKLNEQIEALKKPVELKPADPINSAEDPAVVAAALSKKNAYDQDYPISFEAMPNNEMATPKMSAEEIAALKDKLAEITMPEEAAETQKAEAQQQPAPEPAYTVLTDEERHKLALDWLANLDKSPTHKAYQISGNDKGEHIVKDIAGRQIAIVTPDRIAVNVNVATSNAIKDREAMEHLIQAAVLKHNGAFYANNASPEVAEGIARITQQMLAEGKLYDHVGNKLSGVKFNGVDLKDKQVEPEAAAAAHVVSLDNAPVVMPPSPPVPAEPAKPNYRATLDEAAAKARMTNQTNSTPVEPPATPAKSDDYLWIVKTKDARYKVKKPSPSM